jgi:peptide chain release factor 2
VKCDIFKGMDKKTDELKKELALLEYQMNSPNFWDDKISAQMIIKKISILKNEILGGLKYDQGACLLSIFSGAGGDDAEDFSSMLLRMYIKYFERKNWNWNFIHEHKNDHGGYRNVSIEITDLTPKPPLFTKERGPGEGLGPYGTLKHESGVHRLVRISPFNANAKRHTSFSLVEVIPKLEKTDPIVIIPPEELKFEFSKSGGPGGQNVNKRETAVRIVHLPTNLSAHVTSERSQEQNKEKALEILKGKIFKKNEINNKLEKEGMSISKNTEIEWGNQIRSYVLHPYKMVKDHRTGLEINNVDAVFLDGQIDDFIEAERNLCYPYSSYDLL